MIAWSPLTYTIVVRNAGPSLATNVVLTDTLPDGAVLRSATPSQGSCSGTEIIECEIVELNLTDEWGITMEEGIQNIAVRAAIRKNMVKYAQTYRRPDIMGAGWVAASNNAFWSIIEKHNERRKRTKEEVNYRKVLEDWNQWFQRSVEYG